MLKDIRYSLSNDSKHQEFLETVWSSKLETNRQISLLAFKQTMPNVYHLLSKPSNYPENIFVNKDGELDIVDTSTGKTVYGSDVEKSIERHLTHFESNPLSVSFSNASRSTPLPSCINVLVVFGVGLGHHLLSLLQHYTVKHLVIYEPNHGYLDSSLSTGIWSSVFGLAHQKSTAIYLQTKFDAREVMKELGELHGSYPFESFYIYQHYHNLAFDTAMNFLNTATLKSLGSITRSHLPKHAPDDCIVPWPPVVDTKLWSETHLNNELLQSNLAAFSLFFPEIAREFREYIPSKWKPLANQNGEVNIFHLKTETTLYGESPLAEELQAFDAFVQAPSRERLALGYIRGKTSQHLHQKMVKKIEKAFEGIKADDAVLPNEVNALLLFGIGAGYKLQKFYKTIDIKSLFICEPNRDYFYASLYAIDWNYILNEANENDRRIYLNIGDDGTNLAKDLVGQFHAIGTHVIESMYFSNGYDNPALIPAIKKLREELRSIVALGEYFDYSRYGVAHTKWAIENGVNFYTKKNILLFDSDFTEVPVFIVGNGPSLDKLLPVLKEERARAIIISCGTALQSLYKNGIIPDFHAEIESNRDTYDWATRIGNLDFLKGISLLSCNGMHPDTVKLYKNAFLSFKEGEASTVAINGLNASVNFPELKFSYPTVSNFAINFALDVGFKQIYLIGVDLGFVDGQHHHSKDSGYYKSDGSELYDYVNQSNSSLSVKGNFRSSVTTKFEFNMARKMIEKAVAAYPNQDVYNLNDGAAITGCLPLNPDSVLLLNSSESKKRALEWIVKSMHSLINPNEFSSNFKASFNHDFLLRDIEELMELLEKEILNRREVYELIGEQRKFLIEKFLAKKSIFFYYFNGSLNYINSILTKVVCIRDENIFRTTLDPVLNIWREFLEQVSYSLYEYPNAFDSISTIYKERQEILLGRYLFENKLCLVSKSANNYIKDIERNLKIETSIDEHRTLYQIEFVKNMSDFDNRSLDSEKTAFVISDSSLLERVMNRNSIFDSDIIVFYPIDDKPEINLHGLVFSVVLALVSTEKLQLVLPKTGGLRWYQLIPNCMSAVKKKKFIIFETRNFYAFCQEKLEDEDFVNGAGDRFWMSHDSHFLK
jgi:hypothetical protein